MPQLSEEERLSVANVRGMLRGQAESLGADSTIGQLWTGLDELLAGDIAAMSFAEFLTQRCR